MAKITPTDALAWVQCAMQLVTIGATTYATIKQATADAGWAEDDARLVALDAEYDRRIARAKAAAQGG